MIPLKRSAKAFYVLGMRFMDVYNYDIERVSRCGVKYSAPVHRRLVENLIAPS